MKIIDQTVKLLCDRDEAVRQIKAVEYAGRNCYRSQDRITDDSCFKFVKSLIQRGHCSPLEFANFRFEIVTGRDVMAELTRHRIGASFAIQSQRYVKDNAGGEICFIRPNFWVPPHKRYDDIESNVSRNWENAMAAAECFYNEMLVAGASPQDARKVLPNSTSTVIETSMNLRELLNVLDLRESSAAYPEMRSMAHMMRNEMHRVLPELFEEAEA